TLAEAQPRRLHSNLVLDAAHVAEASPAQSDQLMAEGYLAAQRAEQSAAAAALGQMAARFAAGDSELARTIRKQQDLAAEAKKLDLALIAAMSKPSGERDSAGVQVLRDRADAVGKAIAEVSAGLAKSFPDYAALAAPEPLSIAESRQLLREDEALL